MKRMFWIFSLFLSFYISTKSAWVFIDSNKYFDSQPIQIIVGFKQEVSNEEIIEFVKENNCKLIGPVDEFRVYTLVLPEGVTYKDVVQKFLKDRRVRYVLPNYKMQLQEESLAVDIVTKVRDKNEEVFNEIGFFSALDWIEKLRSENLLAGENKVILAFIDTGVHPELLEKLKEEGMYKKGINIYWDKDKEAYLVNDDVTDIKNWHGTSVATLLSAIGDGVELMPIKFDMYLGTYIEAIKYAIREAKKAGKKLIINSSVSISIEGFIRAEIYSSLANYYIAEKVKELREEGISDTDIYNQWDGIVVEAKQEAIELTNYIFGLILYHILPSFPFWEEEEFNYIKDIKRLSTQQINVIKYAIQAGKQKYYLFSKSLLFDDFKKFSQSALMICSVGNWKNEYRTFPASYPMVVAVGASEIGNSNYGDWVNLYAPGGYKSKIWTLGIKGGKLVEMNVKGTSFSAPLVSNIVSLIFMVDPAFSTKEVRDILKISSENIFSFKIKQYIKKADASNAVKIATIYSGIKDGLKAIKEYFNKIESLKSMFLDPAVETLLYLRELNQKFKQALDKIFILNPDLLDEEKFSSIFSNIFLGEYNFNEAKNDFLLTLWSINSEEINLATGLAIAEQDDIELVKIAIESKVDSLSQKDINQILNYEGNIFDGLKLARQYEGINSIFEFLPKVSEGEIKEDEFLNYIKNIFLDKEQIYIETKDSFKEIFAKLSNNEMDINGAQQELLITIWKIGEEYKEKSLCNLALLEIDCLALEYPLREILKLKEPILANEEIDLIIKNGNNAKQILKIANSYAGIKNILEAIDNFKSPWPEDWISPLVKTNEVSQFLDQLIQNANYMSNEKLSGITEEFYTKIVLNFIKIFCDQETISSEISEITNNNPLHQILWKIITNEIDHDEAKLLILNLIKEESKLDEVDIAINLIQNYYEIGEKEMPSEYRLDFEKMLNYYPIDNPTDDKLFIFMW